MLIHEWINSTNTDCWLTFLCVFFFCHLDLHTDWVTPQGRTVWSFTHHSYFCCYFLSAEATFDGSKDVVISALHAALRLSYHSRNVGRSSCNLWWDSSFTCVLHATNDIWFWSSFHPADLCCHKSLLQECCVWICWSDPESIHTWILVTVMPDRV